MGNRCHCSLRQNDAEERDLSSAPGASDCSPRGEGCKQTNEVGGKKKVRRASSKFTYLVEGLYGSNLEVLEAINECRRLANLHDLVNSELVWRLAQCRLRRNRGASEPIYVSSRKRLVREFLDSTTKFSNRETEKQSSRDQLSMENLTAEASESSDEFLSSPQLAPRDDSFRNTRTLTLVDIACFPHRAPITRAATDPPAAGVWVQPRVGPSAALRTDLDGATYFGAEIEGKKNGFGKQVWPDKSIFEGFWLNDLPHGFGFAVFPDGDYYCGQWRQNQMHGFGLFHARGRVEFLGEFEANEARGFCEQTGQLGDKFVGIVSNKGLQKGLATFSWGSFEGSFNANLAHGFGTLRTPVIVFVASFVQGTPQGPYHCASPKDANQGLSLTGEIKVPDFSVIVSGKQFLLNSNFETSDELKLPSVIKTQILEILNAINEIPLVRLSF